jgi:hypothetical protein
LGVGWFTLKFPAYAIVESVTTDPKGTTVYTNPLAITCTIDPAKPAIVALPIFTSEAQAVAFRQANQPNARWVKLPTHNHLIDFLTKAGGPAMHVAIDPTANSLTTERLCTIEALVTGFKNWRQSTMPPNSPSS